MKVFIEENNIFRYFEHYPETMTNCENPYFTITASFVDKKTLRQNLRILTDLQLPFLPLSEGVRTNQAWWHRILLNFFLFLEPIYISRNKVLHIYAILRVCCALGFNIQKHVPEGV